MSNRSLRTSDLVTDKDGRLSLTKIAAGVSIATALCIGSVAAAKHFLHGDARQKCIERIDAKQDEDHDTLIKVETKVEQIQVEQREMRADVKLILQKVDRNGS